MARHLEFLGPIFVGFQLHQKKNLEIGQGYELLQRERPVPSYFLEKVLMIG
jgi:hypothetical protein